MVTELHTVEEGGWTINLYALVRFLLIIDGRKRRSRRYPSMDTTRKRLTTVPSGLEDA